MGEDRSSSDSRKSAVIAAEYTAATHARHRSKSGTRRLALFALASVWGFTVGVTGLLAGLKSTGQDVQPELRAILALIPAFLISVAGGLVMAAAYKEVRRR
jgi:hypothetical protein